jgi:hypothetical protein
MLLVLEGHVFFMFILVDMHSSCDERWFCDERFKQSCPQQPAQLPNFALCLTLFFM